MPYLEREFPPPEGLHMITNPRSRARGMYVHVVKAKRIGGLLDGRSMYLVRLGHGRAFWTNACWVHKIAEGHNDPRTLAKEFLEGKDV